MSKKQKYLTGVLAVALVLLGFGASEYGLHARGPRQPLSSQTYASSVLPNFTHIFQITMENTSYDNIIGSSSAPYINSLVSKGGLATQFYGFTHPSLPNYFVLTAGQTPNDSYVYGDCGQTADCPQSFVSLPEEIEASGRTWKGYFQSMPSNCDLTRTWPYTPHYNPFVYYSRLLNSGDCAKNVVPDTQFYTDLTNHTLPNYVWFSPDLCHDGHLWTSNSGTCPNGGPYTTYPESVATADTYLSTLVPKILASPEYQNNGLLIITWDEGNLSTNEDDSGCCGVANGGHIVTLLLSPAITPGIQKSVSETAYSILRTIEDAWSLSPMATEGSFNSMTEFFSAPTTGPQLGDCDGDGHVTITDLSILLSNYGTAYTACDFNKDGIVNILDLSTLLTYYGT